MRIKARKMTAVTAVNLLGDIRIRHGLADGRAVYALDDLLAVLADAREPEAYWAELKRREPALGVRPARADFETASGGIESLRAVDGAGLWRVVQAIPTPAAERLKRWLAESGAQRVEEQDDPEAALARVRRAYEERGHPARWVDQRLRGISTRNAVTGEWARRGATASDEYRALTNALIAGAFGMEVEAMRRQKGLTGTTANLRDAMTDFELALTSLAETAAVELHRARDSRGLAELLEDAGAAGRAAGLARGALAGLSLGRRGAAA